MTTEPSHSVAPPDWQTIAEEIRCPLCGYNLHGLAEPRCPECGYTFDWPDLLEPTRRLHPYLFEHHPETNVRSFWRTAAGALLPRRFWRTLQPVQPSRPRRLILYWILTVLVCWVCMQMAIAADVGLSAYIRIRNVSAYRAAVLAGQDQVKSPDPQFGPVGSPITDPKLLRQYLDRYFATGLSVEWLKWMGRVYVNDWLRRQVLLLPLTWPWLLFASLMIFQWSMRRAKVRPVHVLRCTIYSGGTLAWVGLMAFVPFAAEMRSHLFGWSPDIFWVLGCIAYGTIGGLVLSMVYQLIVAYRLYMRFDNAVATVLAALVIGLLVGLQVYLLLLAAFPRYLPGIDWRQLGLI